MRGRWASAAIGAGISRSRAHAEMDQQAQGYEAQLQQAQRQIEAQQRQIEALQHQQKQQSGHQQISSQEDVTTKLQKLADLPQKGILTDEEFSKLKMDLISQL
jgi:multidrug resistance efflux pump